MIPTHAVDPGAGEPAEVIVAGAGAGGLMLACELALAGIRTVVLERRADPGREPGRSAHLGDAVRMVDHRGLHERLADGSGPLAAVLAERAHELGVRVRRGHTLIDLEQDDTGVTVVAEGPAGPHRLRAEFLVGADGARSTTRERAGIAPRPADDTPDAVRLRDRRVFLIGDAAHPRDTTDDAGIDRGLADAFNLGWKLAAAILGDAGPDLLDSYERERRPAAERRTDAPCDTGDDDGLVGRLAPEMTLQTIGGPVRLAELTTRALPLLVDRTEQGSLATTLAPWHEEVDVIRARPEPVECATTALFLRPDCQVAWASTSSTPTAAERDELRTVAERWLGPRHA